MLAFAAAAIALTIRLISRALLITDARFVLTPRRSST
jgi:hypothetical protein